MNLVLKRDMATACMRDMRYEHEGKRDSDPYLAAMLGSRSQCLAPSLTHGQAIIDTHTIDYLQGLQA